ncbi:MAG: sigma-70 family RNA polymerase sigma factor [Opitutaceae bacterium]|nr:sigma-70 family RNA polymerase sigma factor [Opitutaceae bacterium]
MSLPSATPAQFPSVDQTRWFLKEVQPHESKLRAWLHARFPKLGDVDDILQETYLRIVRAKGTGRVSHPKAYLFATARNAALDHYRRNQIVAFERLAEITDSSVLIEEAHAAEPTDHDQELEILTAAIRALPERCREVLILRKHHGLSHREIADQLGISPHTVNAQITVAMKKCREYFRLHGLTEDRPNEASSLRR